MDDTMTMPGFRFHPTDEELVGFYLKRKIEQRTVAFELIKQLDIYKYDPWDLPKVTEEKEWYFYCPRDRKYKNSARPNRVTGSGFWKATGTDRPVYSSDSSRCIGLKKSLVFYKGKAARGLKTDWMMHEFRLPSQSPSNSEPLKPNDSWAICRIFKRASSVTQRTLSHTWNGPEVSDNTGLFMSDNRILLPAKESSVSQYGSNISNSTTSSFWECEGFTESLDYSEMQAIYDSLSADLQ